MTQRHRPRPDAPTARTAAEAIAGLYTRRYPDDIARLPDDMLGIIAFALQHNGNRRLARCENGRKQIREVFPHAITILDFIAGELARLRLAVIEDARAAGMGLGEIAGPLGTSSRQAVYEEITRLQAATNGRPRDARAWRKERLAALAPVRTPGASGTTVWPDGVLQAAQALLRRREALPDAVDDEVEMLILSLPDGEYASPRGMPAALSLLVRELRQRPDLDPSVRQLVGQAAAALAEYNASRQGR